MSTVDLVGAIIIFEQTRANMEKVPEHLRSFHNWETASILMEEAEKYLDGGRAFGVKNCVVAANYWLRLIGKEYSLHG